MSTIENVEEAVNSTETMYTLSQILPWLAVALFVALILGAMLGYFCMKKVPSFSLEKFIMVISGAVVAGAVFCEVAGVLEKFSSAVITVFSSIIFSWLLTKSSNKEEWKQQEQELALRSYRHIDYIETASKTASRTIEQYINEENLSEEERLILSRAMDYIGYIQGGINTCKLDWVDLMSDEKKNDYLHKDPLDQSVIVNQEDA